MKKIILIVISAIIAHILLFGVLLLTDSAIFYPPLKYHTVIVKTGDTVSWDEIEEAPDYVDEYMCSWFVELGPITKYKLKNYMKENDLVISSGKYSYENTIRFEELKELLEFEKMIIQDK